MLLDASLADAGRRQPLQSGAGRAAPRVTACRPPRVLIFDSGLGGLTVLDAVAEALPGAALCFAADDAVFPYGRLSEADLVERVVAVMDRLVQDVRPDIVVIACNTASTLVLPPLRARFPERAFVGTVPAIKPAAAASRSRLVSVLATPGTVARQYTRDLVARFAGDCRVTLIGAPRLAALAEAAMRGETIADAAVAAEIAGAFVEADGRRTDTIVLACTHYPLLLDRLERLASWTVNYVDPAPAIARRVVAVARERGADVEATATARGTIPALMTSGRPPGAALAAVLHARNLAWVPGAPF